MKKRNTAPELLQLTYIYILYDDDGEEVNAVQIQTTKLRSMQNKDPTTDTEL